jgi:hypothetical protein
MTKQVKMNALIKRVNRVLNKNNERLQVLRGDQNLNDMGRYFITDIVMNLVVAQHVDPVVVGRELGVLKVSEQVV